jgi:hypothetical protein
MTIIRTDAIIITGDAYYPTYEVADDAVRAEFAAADIVAQAAAEATAQAALDAHTGDTSGAHADSAITYTPAGTGAVATTVQAKLREFVSVKDFGAVGDGTTDDLAAFNSAIAAVKTIDSIRANGTKVLVPNGTYKLSGPLVIDNTITLEGTTNQFPYAEGGSILQFSTDDDGIYLPYYTGTYESSSGVMGQGITIKNLTIKGTKDSGTGNGIFINTKANIENVYVTGFSGHGVCIIATAPNGNANNCLLKNVKAYNNDKSGFYTDGADANACLIELCDGSHNGEWGFYDSSFLGNTYIACHTAENTSGAYKSDDPNARNVFLGCYSESGQPASDGLSPALFIGGLHAAGFTSGSTSPYAQTALNNFRVSRGVESSMLNGTDYLEAMIGGDASNGDILKAYHTTTAPNYWRLKFTGTNLDFNYQNLDAYRVFRIFGPTTTETFGRSSAYPYAFQTDRLFIGNLGNARRLTSASTAPTEGDLAVGDVVFKIDAVAGGLAGWICTTAGTPGTWAPFGHSVIEGSATFDPANLVDGAGETTTVTVTGAALGDFAEASFSQNLQGITLTAWVSAANTVSVRFQNETGGTLDLASGTLRAAVRRA